MRSRAASRVHDDRPPGSHVPRRTSGRAGLRSGVRLGGERGPRDLAPSRARREEAQLERVDRVPAAAAARFRSTRRSIFEAEVDGPPGLEPVMSTSWRTTTSSGVRRRSRSRNSSKDIDGVVDIDARRTTGDAPDRPESRSGASRAPGTRREGSRSHPEGGLLRARRVGDPGPRRDDGDPGRCSSRRPAARSTRFSRRPFETRTASSCCSATSWTRSRPRPSRRSSIAMDAARRR